MPVCGLRLKNICSIKSSHPPQDVDQVRHRQQLPVPGLPQQQDRLRRARSRREVRHVPVHIQSLGQHPPVVALLVRGVHQGAESVNQCRVQTKFGALRLLLRSREGKVSWPLAEITIDGQLTLEAAGHVLLADAQGEVESGGGRADVVVAAVGALGGAEGEGTVEAGVDRVPDVKEGHLEVVGALLTGPLGTQGFDLHAEVVVVAVAEEHADRVVQEAAVVALLGVRHKVEGVVAVGEAVHSDGDVVGGLAFLSKGRQAETLGGWPGLGRFAGQREGRQLVSHDVTHGEIELSIHRGVDRLLTQGHDFVPHVGVLTVLVVLHEGDGPVTMSKGGAVRQADCHGLLQLDGGVSGAADDHGREESLATQKGRVLGVVEDGHEDVGGVSGGESTGRNGQEDVAVGDLHAYAGGRHGGPRGEAGIRWGVGGRRRERGRGDGEGGGVRESACRHWAWWRHGCWKNREKVLIIKFACG